MHQIEPDPPAQNRLMMGPDGTVHVVPSSAAKNSPAAELEGRPGRGQRANTSGHINRPSDRDAGLLGIRRALDGGVCFSYSAPMPPTDRDAARQALQDIRRMPEGGVCFRYSVPMPLTDRDAALRGLRDIWRMPQGGVCFSY